MYSRTDTIAKTIQKNISTKHPNTLAYLYKNMNSTFLESAHRVLYNYLLKSTVKTVIISSKAILNLLGFLKLIFSYFLTHTKEVDYT